MLQEPAPAKLNWTLRITGKGPGGYHRLHSYVFFAPEAADIIYFEPTDSGDLQLRIEGIDNSVLPPRDNNAIIKAAHAMAEHYQQSIHGTFILKKHLPIAAGLGGGTADAAATIRLLHRYWEISAPLSALSEWSVSLGADVPVCLASQWSLMQGIGEKVSSTTPPPDWPEHAHYCLITTPNIHVPTAKIFSNLQVTHWKQNAHYNHLEPVATELYPEIAMLLEWLRKQPAAITARMSGSGASCFTLFEHQHDAENAQLAYRQWQPDGWSALSTIC